MNHDGLVSTAPTVLGELPVFEPDIGLGERIASAQGRHLRQRRTRRIAWSAGVLACSTLFAWLVLPLATKEVASPGELVEVRQQSRQLEADWRSVAAGEPLLDARLRMRLQGIDARLQTAYDQSAGAGELVRLWKERNAVMRELLDRDRGGQRLVSRI